MHFSRENTAMSDKLRHELTDEQRPLCRLQDFPARFRAKVNVDPSGCWIWTGSTVHHPNYPQHKYGQYCAFVAFGRPVFAKAHRFAYKHAYGHIPAGLEIDHMCKVKLCVNPAHLRAVTHQENVQTRSQHGPKAKMPRAEYLALYYKRNRERILEQNRERRRGAR